MTDQKTPDTFQIAAGTTRLAAEAGSSLGLVGEKGAPWGAGGPVRGSVPGPWDHGLSRRRMLD